MYQKLVSGRGEPGDVELIELMSQNIKGKAFCPLADACLGPVQSSLALFRDEYEHLAEHGTPKYTKTHWWSA